MQAASGAKDLNPQQVEVNHLIAKKLSTVYKLWGYEEVSPPNIETLDTLMAGDAIASKDIVKLVSNEPLGLRPEMTTSIARAASTRLVNKPRPLRLWAEGTIFNSKEVPEAGTYIEENLQSGVELFGIKSATAEIELVSLLLESLKSLELSESFKPTLLIGHTELMDLILKQINQQQRNSIRSTLINYNKVELNNLKIDSESLNKLIEVSEIRGEPVNVIKKLNLIYGNNIVINELNELFNVIQPIADQYKVRIQLDPSFQPHYELYNGLVFQLVCKSENNQVVIAKGGRYDKIVQRFSKDNKDVAGVGFSYAVDRTRELINEANINSPNQTKILIAYKSNELFQKALIMQREFHLKGKQALIELEARHSKQEALDLLTARKCNDLKWLD